MLDFAMSGCRARIRSALRHLWAKSVGGVKMQACSRNSANSALATQGLDRGNLKVLLQRCPALESALARERLLHLAKPRGRRMLRQHFLEPGKRRFVTATDRLEPPLGLLAQGFEACACSNVLHVEPSFRMPDVRFTQAERRLVVESELPGWEIPCRGREAPQSALRKRLPLLRVGVEPSGRECRRCPSSTNAG